MGQKYDSKKLTQWMEKLDAKSEWKFWDNQFIL
jgi:hypothetical protein